MQHERQIGDTVINLRTHPDHSTDFERLAESVLHDIVTTGGPHLEIHLDGKVITLQKDENGAVHLDAETLEELAEGLRTFQTSVYTKR